MDHAWRVLEFERILDRLAHQCETELAAVSALRLAPHFKPDPVWEELGHTKQAYDLLANASPPSLGPVRDLRAPLIRANKGATLGGVELIQIAEMLAAMRSMHQFLSTRREPFPALFTLAEFAPVHPKLEQTLFDSLDRDGELRDGASPQLATLRNRKRGMHQKLIERIQAYTNKHREILSDPIYTIRDGRYVVPVKSEHRSKIRGIVHDTSSSGQTVYMEPEDVLQMGNQLREAESAEREECSRILGILSSKVGAVATETVGAIEQFAALDLLFAKAKLAFAMKAMAPQKSAGHGMILEGARHPLLEETGVEVVPIDLELGFTHHGLLITGPNTGGKTVAIKTVGLFTLMAQSGLFLPARECRIGPFTQIWADIGDEQSLQQSLSTFSAHMKNIAAAVKGIAPGALVLFDEIGAGTDPAEGAALARAILRDLVDRGAIVLASTHYGELKAFAYDSDGFSNASMEFDSKTLRPTYRLLMGAPGSSQALRIAERYGIPATIVAKARENLDAGHVEVTQVFEKLEQAQRQARIAQGEADRRLNELKKAEERAAQKLAEADEIRRTVHAKANETIEAALRDIRLEAQRLFEDLKKSAVDQKKLSDVREQLKEVQARGKKRAESFGGSPQRGEAPQLTAGMSVRVEGYSQIGTILEIPNETHAVIQMGPLRLKLPSASLTPVAERASRVSKPSISSGLQKAQTASTEIHLRAMRAEDAIETLEKFLDESVLAGIHQVRIVHGKGEGILRKITRETLSRYRGISTIRDGEPAEGGQGVTIAVLR